MGNKNENIDRNLLPCRLSTFLLSTIVLCMIGAEPALGDDLDPFNPQLPAELEKAIAGAGFTRDPANPAFFVNTHNVCHLFVGPSDQMEGAVKVFDQPKNIVEGYDPNVSFPSYALSLEESARLLGIDPTKHSREKLERLVQENFEALSPERAKAISSAVANAKACQPSSGQGAFIPIF